MKIEWKNNVCICTTRHKNGTSEVRGFSRDEVMDAAFRNLKDEMKDDGLEDNAPYDKEA